MQAWDIFLSKLEEKLGSSTVNRWLRRLKIVQFDACNLYLEAENTFQVAWFKEHIEQVAKKEFLNNNGRPIKVHFSLEKKQKKKSPLIEPSQEIEIQGGSIDPSMTFSNFISDEKNILTIEFFSKIVPGSFNPIFLFGAPGTGKTHLLMACANKLLAHQLSVFYVHAETFTEHVVKAIRNSQMRRFREIYRHQDVLIIDDIHYLARKNATQEELFHTFNTLHTMGKQIILASHSPPSKLEEIEPRLISRFEWGILLELHPLYKTKCEEVLKNRARLLDFSLSDEIIQFLIKSFPSSPKSMMRAFEALVIRYRKPSPISFAEAKDLLSDLISVEKNSLLTPEKILRATSTYFGIRTGDILGKSQSKECSFPRKLAMFLCRKKLNLPYPSIGRIFHRDHSTVMSNIRQIEKNQKEEEISEALEEIQTLLTPN